MRQEKLAEPQEVKVLYTARKQRRRTYDNARQRRTATLAKAQTSSALLNKTREQRRTSNPAQSPIQRGRNPQTHQNSLNNRFPVEQTPTPPAANAAGEVRRR